MARKALNCSGMVLSLSLAVITVFIPPLVSDIQRHVKKGKQLNEHMFEYPTTPIPNKDRLFPPRSKETGLPEAEVG